MGKFEDMSEQLAEAQRAARAWKRRALGAEARVTALESDAHEHLRIIDGLRAALPLAVAAVEVPLPVMHGRCKNVSTANSGRVQCSRTSGHEGPHHDACDALFWPNV